MRYSRESVIAEATQLVNGSFGEWVKEVCSQMETWGWTYRVHLISYKSNQLVSLFLHRVFIQVKATSLLNAIMPKPNSNNKRCIKVWDCNWIRKKWDGAMAQWQRIFLPRRRSQLQFPSSPVLKNQTVDNVKELFLRPWRTAASQNR